MRATHRDAEERYEEFRKLARDKILASLPYADKKLIKLERISAKALVASKVWASDPSRRVNWDWEGGGYDEYSFRHPKRFEMATWYGSKLASLCLGRPSYMGGHLRLDFAEANPSENPLKGRIIPIILSAGELYASIIGASEIRLIDPIDSKLVNYYSSFGYRYVSRNVKKHYLVKDLT